MKEIFILFICMGNTCRSPMAEGYIHQLISDNNLTQVVHVDSAGTHSSRLGSPPDPRAVKVSKANNFNIEHIRSRKLEPEDAKKFDYILVMDQENLKNVLEMFPKEYHSKVKLLLEYGPARDDKTIKDPYSGSSSDYIDSFNLIKEAVEGFFDIIVKEHKLL